MTMDSLKMKRQDNFLWVFWYDRRRQESQEGMEYADFGNVINKPQTQISEQ